MTQVVEPTAATSLNYVLDMFKCFLCDREFFEGEEPQFIFDKKFQHEQEECSVSVALSAALGKQLDENSVHSQLLCDACHAMVLEYEEIEQRLYEIRYKILSTYNITAKQNDLDPIVIEIDGVVEEFDNIKVLEQDFCTNESQKDQLRFANAGIIKEENSCETELDIQNTGSPTDNVIVIDENDYKEDNNAYICNRNDFLITELCDSDKAPDETCADDNLIDEMHNLKSQPESDFENFGTSADDCIDVVSEDIIYEQIIEHTLHSNDEECERSEAQSVYENSSSITDVPNVTNNGASKQKKTSHSNKQIKDFQSPPYELKDGKYYCLVCPEKPEYGPKLFPNHMRTLHNYRFFVCDLCNKGFTKRQDLKDHLDEGHRIMEENFDCDICQRKFDNFRLFRIHKRQHFSTINKPFQCNVCYKKYSSMNLLDEHMNMHTGKRPFKCDKCPKDFASKYTLLAHAKIHTNRERPHQCNECNKAFFNQQNLLQHKKIHSGVKAFVCDVCSKAFGTQHNLDVHKIVHSGNKPFICRMCDKAFARRAEIRDHERTHTGERPFVCDICSMAFAQRSNLSTHKKTTHFNDKRHKCNICDRSFKRRRLLEYHTQSAHTGERPYKCDICSSTFVYPEHFKKHILIHSGIKPYACEVCGKQFNSRDNRNAHRFTHSEKKPYECLKCGAGFMRKPLLLAHMKNTMHTNDTIIVNQPQINISIAPDLAKKELDVLKDSESDTKVVYIDGDTELRSEGSYNGEGGGFIIDHYDDSNDDVISQQYIKDEVGEEKYLQFTEIDKDGQQTLTWVDIEAKD